MGTPQEQYIWWGSLADTERMQIFNKSYARVNNVVKNNNCSNMLILPFRLHLYRLNWTPNFVKPVVKYTRLICRRGVVFDDTERMT